MILGPPLVHLGPLGPDRTKAVIFFEYPGRFDLYSK